jgi:hypothetical protein
MTSLYSDTAKFGRFMTIIGTIFGVIVGIIFLIVGIYLVRKKEKHTKSVTANITNKVKCEHILHDPKEATANSYHCELEVMYKINGKVYNKTLQTTDSTDYTDVQTVTLYYDPDNPSDIVIHKEPTKTIGWIMIAISLFAIIMSFIQLYIVRKYKIAAAAAGVGGAARMMGLR